MSKDLQHCESILIHQVYLQYFTILFAVLSGITKAAYVRNLLKVYFFTIGQATYHRISE